MEFPGILGVGLFRLRELIRRAPLGALGPLMGIMAADISIDMAAGRHTSVLIDLAIAPILAITVSQTAQRSHAGISGPLLLLLGAISALGASMLLGRGFAVGSGAVLMMGIRHLTVGAYAWAAIATEPPRRRQPLRFAPVSV